MSTNFFKDNEDLQYYFEKGVDWEKLVRLTEMNYKLPDGYSNLEEAKGVYEDVLNMFGEFVAKEVAPHAKAFDEKGVQLVDGEAVESEEWVSAFDQMAQLGMHGLAIPREFGGMNAPVLLFYFNSEIIARADVSAMTHMSFHAAIALCLLVYSFHEGSTTLDPKTLEITDSRFREYIEEIAAGEAGGAMDITEPDAGSDMAMLKAKARQDEDGTWRITGNKIFITSGHNKYHIVIARTEEDQSLGLKGLSLFIVKAYEDKPDGTRERYVDIVRIEDKLGHNGSATCALEFDNTKAELLGERGEGFKLMLLLMNNARVGVGFESLGLMESARRQAKAYAAERVSMEKTIDQHEMIASYLDDMEVEAAALRAMVVHAGFHEEYSQKLTMIARQAIKGGVKMPELGLESMDDLEKQLEHHQWEARRFTPLLKYFGGEYSVKHAQQCIQIHGGAGYTKDYGAEKLFRDAMVLPIYEGTSQIQALMTMKDSLMRVIDKPQEFLGQIAHARWLSVAAKDPEERRVARLRVQTLGAVQTLLQRTIAAKFKDIRNLPITKWKDAFVQMDPKRDFSFAMLHAERLIQLQINSQVAELFLDQAQQHEERRELLQRWLEKVEPHSRMLIDEIQNVGGYTFNRLAKNQA